MLNTKESKMKKIICFIMICTIILLPLQVEALELEETNKQEVIVELW